jgi:hypothetical protein
VGDYSRPYSTNHAPGSAGCQARPQVGFQHLFADGVCLVYHLVDGSIQEAMMDWADRLAEQRILEAEREGVFDNLPGEGKPLPEDPFAALPDEIRMAARVLAMCGCAPQEVGLLRTLNEARRHLDDAQTAEERAQRMREFCDAELHYNVAMDRHRMMVRKGRGPFCSNRSRTISPW